MRQLDGRGEAGGRELRRALRGGVCAAGSARQSLRAGPPRPGLGWRGPQGEPRAKLHAVVGELIDAARTGGTVRPDVTAADVNMVVCGLAAVIRHSAGDWRRFTEIALSGLRP
ncbi:hypothetical protein ACIBO5_44675 [Nonomuraea angiospora]|uniref:SbtR family transcriptional regulator n=1 Tax=Nonomuraea angiospora TaxID=46172 RepID=UPI0037B79B9D